MKRRVTHCGDGVYMRIVNDVCKADFDAYVSSLEKDGADVRVSSICENEFLSAVRGEGYIYAAYVPCRSELHLLFTEKGELIPERLGDRESYAGEKTLTQLAPNDEAKNFGMCYIFSLGEGHFLIYDGLGSAGEDEVKLYEALLSSTPEGKKPVVDAWILTHPHYDHIAGVHKFALRYKDDTEVRNFVMNMRDAYNSPSAVSVSFARATRNGCPRSLPHIPTQRCIRHTRVRSFPSGTRVSRYFTRRRNALTSFPA